MPTRRQIRMAAEQRRSAEASARAAEAQARAMEAQTRATEARLKSEAAARRDAAARSPFQRAWNLGVNVAMPVAGIGIGQKMAKGIETRHIAATAARNRELVRLAAAADQAMKKIPKTGSSAALLQAKRLAAIVASADKIGLAVSRGPKGLGMAAVLAAEGVMARFVVAPQVKNETAREVIRGAGTAFGFTASTMIAKRMIANATSRAVPNSVALSSIEAARRIAGPAAMAAPAATGIGSRLLSLAGKVALPALALTTAYSAYQGYKKDGLRGAALGAGDNLTFGLATPLARMAGLAPPTARERLAQTRAMVARSAAVRAAHVARYAPQRAIARAKGPSGDGMTAAYTRVQRGKTVRVKGYRTPTRR